MPSKHKQDITEYYILLFWYLTLPWIMMYLSIKIVIFIPYHKQYWLGFNNVDLWLNKLEINDLILGLSNTECYVRRK